MAFFAFTRLTPCSCAIHLDGTDVVACAHQAIDLVGGLELRHGRGNILRGWRRGTRHGCGGASRRRWRARGLGLTHHVFGRVRLLAAEQFAPSHDCHVTGPLGGRPRYAPGMQARWVCGAAIALAGAITLSGCSSPAYESDNYTFTVPATDYVDAQTVLVQDGVVTDVWMSETDKQSESYGYTPRLPSAADPSEKITEADGLVTVCHNPDVDPSNCTVYEDVTAISATNAALMGAWDGPADGTYTVTSRSVTWEETSVKTVTVTSGDLATIAPGNPEFRVRYWVDGAAEPFAVCTDDPNSYDEEGCYTWTPADPLLGPLEHLNTERRERHRSHRVAIERHKRGTARHGVNDGVGHVDEPHVARAVAALHFANDDVSASQRAGLGQRRLRPRARHTERPLSRD